MDKEIAEYLYEFAESWNLKVRKDTKPDNIASSYFIISGNKYRNPLFSEMRKLNFINNKHLPLDYIHCSSIQRQQLLAGLIDSDGYKLKGSNGKEAGGYEIATIYEHFAKEIVLLCHSLGYRASYSKKKTSIKSINYEGIAHRVRIYGDFLETPIKLPRRKTTKNTMKVKPYLTGIKSGSVIKDGAIDFILKNGDEFLISDFTILKGKLI